MSEVELQLAPDVETESLGVEPDGHPPNNDSTVTNTTVRNINKIKTSLCILKCRKTQWD